MPSEYASKTPTLIPLEKAGPKGFIRMVFPLELGESYDADEIFGILKQGLEAAKQRAPTLGCEGVPDTEAKQAGVLKAHKYDDYDTITKKDLRAPGAFPHTYAEIKAKGFPLAAFNGDLLCRRFTWPSPGERLPAADFQANFIPGGLIITGCFFHVFGDAKTYYTWLEIWAEECRRLQGETGPRNEIPDAFFTDREKHMKPSSRNAGKPEDHPEILVLPFTPEGFPPKMISRDHVGQVFRLNAEQLAALKADAAPKNAANPSDVPYISTNDALSALMWRSVMAAQFPLEELEGDPTSIFNIAVDGRPRTDPPVHPRTLGNWLGWVAPQMPIRQMLSRDTVADPAVAIRKAVSKLNDQYVDSLSTLFENVVDVNRVVATAFLDVPGFNCVQTSWINLGVYGLDWGKTLGGKIQAVRSPDVGVINGGSLVLPALPGGGIELIIGVESKCLPRLMKDPLLAKYATPITL
ncbi:transferase family-domain-containing protein [Xylaria bambusicola]|uniref:transferase family-domain-containing protein n=1 Tax=Xylaria bambusicola TaxID=326684 RepID=UPI002008C871|nr:transferase family-domain-containing protein [Xylaria bambusicola]KAI0521976.1 transferase family-domain-containing protein [Xylaria bambusicola]